MLKVSGYVCMTFGTKLTHILFGNEQDRKINVCIVIGEAFC